MNDINDSADPFYCIPASVDFLVVMYVKGANSVVKIRHPEDDIPAGKDQPYTKENINPIDDTPTSSGIEAKDISEEVDNYKLN